MSIIRQGFESADLDVPVVLPTLNLDFANSQSLDKRITFSRGSIGTRVNRNGLIETIPANQPRFDFDPVTGECRGLLIEESRTNLITTSNPASGGDANFGVIASATTSPDGTTNASFLYEKTTNNFKIHSVGFTAVIGTTYCASAFVKYAGSSRYGRLKTGSTNTIIINLTNGAILSSTGTCGVIPYPNGWYRIYSIFTATSTSENLQLFLMNYNGALSQYPGDGSSGYYVYGMQAEAGAFPTSYIPTTASTVTRSADNASMTGTNFSSWYNQTESTIFCKFNAYNVASTQYTGVFQITGQATTGINRIQFLLNGPGGSSTNQPVYHNLYQNGVNFADYFGFVYRTGPTKNIIRYKDKDYFVVSKDGNIRRNTQARLQTIPLTKNMDTLNIGKVDFYLNGAISKFAYYPKALNDAEIQYLTQ